MPGYSRDDEHVILDCYYDGGPIVETGTPWANYLPGFDLSPVATKHALTIRSATPNVPCRINVESLGDYIARFRGYGLIDTNDDFWVKLQDLEYVNFGGGVGSSGTIWDSWGESLSSDEKIVCVNQRLVAADTTTDWFHALIRISANSDISMHHHNMIFDARNKTGTFYVTWGVDTCGPHYYYNCLFAHGGRGMYAIVNSTLHHYNCAYIDALYAGPILKISSTCNSYHCATTLADYPAYQMTDAGDCIYNVVPADEYVDYTLDADDNDYHLAAGADCIDAGAEFTDDWDTDIEGTARAGTWEIGPYIFVPAAGGLRRNRARAAHGGGHGKG